MAHAAGTTDMCDVLIVHGRDGHDWFQYLKEIFHPSQQTLSYELHSDSSLNREDLRVFRSSKCILLILSGELVNCFSNPDLVQRLRTVLRPPQKVVILFCGVTDCDDFVRVFKDWSRWKRVTSDDQGEDYIAAVEETIKEVGLDSGCESVTDTDAEAEEPIYSKKIETYPNPSAVESSHSNLTVVVPERIQCGVKTKVYIISKCKLDSQVNNEVEFLPTSQPSLRIQATLENEYTISLDAPDLPSGRVSLNVYSDNVKVCTGQINYYTDMEEIRNLLENATNPVEFMCQAFKIVPYNIDILDKLLTESLKKNIPASGLHLFGIHQIEEEDLSTNQRDDELPTLLHFAAKYGLKTLTALLLTCPGALQAYSVCNKHQDFPNGIAEKYGHKDLRQFMDDYVETVGLLKSHIKEEMMQEEDEDESTYEMMADTSTELLMRCSLNPGCDEDIYESMAGLSPDSSKDLYVQMFSEPTYSHQPRGVSRTSNEFMISKFFKDSLVAEDGSMSTFVKDDPVPPEIKRRAPIPVPRPESSDRPEEKELYISKVFAEKAGEKRPENLYSETVNQQQEPTTLSRHDRASSSIYDPFAGMKTPGQRQLITLQEQVKSGMISMDEAVARFKEWHLNQKRRSESFKYQQVNLQLLRESITRRQAVNTNRGKHSDLEITKPIKHKKDRLPKVVAYDTYEYCPRQSIQPAQRGLQRGNWNTESSSSTASSASSRSSTRSTTSHSSGVEGDSEDNEIPDPRPGARTAPLSSPRPPRIPPRNPISFAEGGGCHGSIAETSEEEEDLLPASAERRPQSGSFKPPPVPPRGR